jgi:spermidine synthase
LFVLCSALGLPPVAWFALGAAMLCGLLYAVETPFHPTVSVGLAAILVLLSWCAGLAPGSLEVRWSPYQKLVVYPTHVTGEDSDGIGDYQVTVNNTGYQAMINLNEAHVAATPDSYPKELRGLSQYDLPFLLHPGARKALLVGAGTGNDAAGALRHGVEQITAVEIDPEIIALGRRYHPERPYDSPKVKLINDDARAFFATCRDRFDVIVFGLLDSHTTTAMTNARLDHYVYTKESMAHARSLLAGGGIMVLSFEAQKPYVADRMNRELKAVFGSDPISFRVPPTPYGWGGLIFVAGDHRIVERQIAADSRLAAQIEKWRNDRPVTLSGTAPIATDDWPYIYLDRPRIPLLYFLLTGVAFLMMGTLTAILAKTGIRDLLAYRDRTRWHFFFLGAAFMLLEVQNISKTAVVLGNTWLVNAVIISAILAMILLANLVVARWPLIPGTPVYIGLCATCLIMCGIDLSRFGFLPYASKALIVGFLTSLPMLFSGIVFIQSFSRVTNKNQALGINLLGALVGGLLQSVTFVTGIRALLLIVVGLYLAAMATRPRAPFLGGGKRRIPGVPLSLRRDFQSTR